MLSFILVCSMSIVALFFWSIRSKFVKYNIQIPGPPPLPLIGNLLYLAGKKGMTVYEIFHELCTHYGPIVSISVGAYTQVVIEDYDLVKEVLLGDSWGNRVELEWQQSVRSFGKNLGMLFSNGEVNQKMRRFTVRTLKEFGFGKQSSLEEVIQAQLCQLMGKLDGLIGSDGNAGTPVKVNQLFTISILNTIWTMVAGAPFSHENEELRETLLRQEEDVRKASFGKIESPGVLFQAFPFLAKIIPFYGVPKSPAILNKMFLNILGERRKEGAYREDIRDYIDVFLREIDARKDDPVDSQIYTDEQFAINTLDLFGGGSETTNGATEFSMLYLTKYPEIQRKVQAEIDSVIGFDRLPSAADKPNMPYTEAFSLEVQRLGSIGPIIPRMSTKATKLGPYPVPKGTCVTCNMVSMNRNEEKWEDSLSFRPERFLDKDMRIVNSDKILPFGLGSRACIGEAMAKLTIFLIVTTMMQKYSLGISPVHGIMGQDDAVDGLTRGPKRFHVLIKSRHATS